MSDSANSVLVLLLLCAALALVIFGLGKMARREEQAMREQRQGDNELATETKPSNAPNDPAGTTSQQQDNLQNLSPEKQDYTGQNDSGQNSGQHLGQNSTGPNNTVQDKS